MIVLQPIKLVFSSQFSREFNAKGGLFARKGHPLSRKGHLLSRKGHLLSRKGHPFKVVNLLSTSVNLKKVAKPLYIGVLTT
jgi:hypothetical protein